MSDVSKPDPGGLGGNLDGELDIDALRHATPGCERQIHFNNAGCALPATATLEVVMGYLRREAEVGGYEAAEEYQARLQAVYTSVARLLNADNSEIALCESASRAWMNAFYSIPLSPGERILTGRSEYASNYIAMLQRAKRDGVKIEVIDDDEYGQVDLGRLERRLDDDVALVALTHCPSHNGLVNPAAEVGRLLRGRRALFLLDACQSAGQLALDVLDIQCDFLSATGRKYLRAPRGTGFLYVSRRVLNNFEPAAVDMRGAEWARVDDYRLRDDARRFETWEANHALRLGLDAAIRQALAIGMDAIARRIGALAARLRARLAEIGHITPRDKGARRGGIVTFDSTAFTAEQIYAHLRRNRVNLSISRVGMARLDMERRGLGAVLRASPHIYNTEKEIDDFCLLLRDLR